MGLNNVTWSSELGLGQIIILIAYVIGYLIIYFHQKNKIGTLQQQINTQKGILEQMERFMNMFSVDKLEYFQQLSTKTAQMEKQLAIEEIKSKAKEGFDYVLNEYSATLGLAFKLVDGMPYFPVVDVWLREMEDVQTKPLLLKFLEKRRTQLESEGIDKRGWAANFIMGVNLWGKIVKEKSQSSPRPK